MVSKIFALALLGLFVLLLIYFAYRRAMSHGQRYDSRTLVIGAAPRFVVTDDLEADYQPPIVQPGVINYAAVSTRPVITPERDGSGRFVEGHVPVGVKRGAGGRFVSAKAA